MTDTLASVSFEEFLAGEREGGLRHEYVGGRIYETAGGSERHDLLSSFIALQLGPEVVAAGCRPFTGNRLVKTGGSGAGYYPDFLVACGRASHDLHETEPVLIVEVLSRSTMTIDRREKTLAYFTAPSLELLLLVSQYERRIEVARRGPDPFLQWDAVGPEGLVVTRFGVLGVEQLYDAVDRLAPPPD